MKRALVLCALLVAILAGCREAEKPKPLSEPGEKLYALKGKIVSRDAGANLLTIDHEAIPGFMEAMTMEYSVRGAKVDALPPNGSRVEAKLHVTDNSYWVTDVRSLP